MLILGIILGIILTVSVICIIAYVIDKKDKKPNKKSYIRRGIYNATFTFTSMAKGEKDVEVQFELGELEYTGTKSKVEMIHYTASGSEYMTDDWKEKLRKSMDSKWMESSVIEWINETPKKRVEKIDEILNNK